MTRISGKPPGLEAARYFAQRARKTNPLDETASLRDFHAAQESVIGRDKAEDVARQAIGKKSSPSFDTLDPRIQQQLKDAGYEPPPKPKSP